MSYVVSASTDTLTRGQDTLAALRSRPALKPQRSHRKVLIPNPSHVLFLDAQFEQVMVV